MTRPRLNSRRKRKARRDEYRKWFRNRCVDAAWMGVNSSNGYARAATQVSCDFDFDGEIVDEDGNVNWAAAFAAP